MFGKSKNYREEFISLKSLSERLEVLEKAILPSLTRLNDLGNLDWDRIVAKLEQEKEELQYRADHLHPSYAREIISQALTMKGKTDCLIEGILRYKKHKEDYNDNA